jgi:hypothetical protein
MMGVIPKAKGDQRHIGEMTGGQQSAGRLGEEFNPFFGRWLGLRARSERRSPEHGQLAGLRHGLWV